VLDYRQTGWTGLAYPTRKYYPSWATPEDHPAVQAAVEAHRGLFGRPPTVGRWTFSTNGVATMGLSKIPTFGFGPGTEEMAHAADESVAIDDLVRCAAFYAYFPWLVVGQ